MQGWGCSGAARRRRRRGAARRGCTVAAARVVWGGAWVDGMQVKPWGPIKGLRGSWRPRPIRKAGEHPGRGSRRAVARPGEAGKTGLARRDPRVSGGAHCERLSGRRAGALTCGPRRSVGAGSACGRSGPGLRFGPECCAGEGRNGPQERERETWAALGRLGKEVWAGLGLGFLSHFYF